MNPPPPSRASSPEELRRYDLLLAGFDLLDQAIAVFDATPKLVTWNKAMLRLLDFPESLVRVGTPFEEFVRFNVQRGEYSGGALNPAEVERLVTERMAAVRAFQPHQAERTRPNGQVLSIRGVPIPNLGFVTLWTDITEQRRYERLIERQNAELENRVRARTAELEAAKTRLDNLAGQLTRSEERMRRILDTIPAMIAYVDAGERYRFANRGYANWFGLDQQSIVGKSILEVVGPDAYAQVRPQLEQAYTGEQVSYEYSRINAAGQQVHARSAVVPEASEAGGVQGFFVLSIDITEQKAGQAVLIQAQKMEAVGQLTGGLAHDFNNLLTIITGNLAALRDKLPAHQGFEDYLDPALSAARRGTELIRRLLTFSRQQPLAPSPVEVGALVHDMTPLLARSLTERITMRLDLPTEKLYALVDPHQLENALLNLAINARDAMPAGGTLTLRTRDEAGGDVVRVEVADSGQGMDETVRERVFEPFFTTKAGSGNGLGLSIVYGFVKQSGGEIAVESAPGAGSVFVLRLPSRRPEIVADLPAAQAEDAVAGLSVLLVEDDPEVRAALADVLRATGHAVTEAASAREALAALEGMAVRGQTPVSLLLSDVDFGGGMHGVELMREVARRHPELPRILMSGLPVERLMSRFGLEDGDLLLNKPFTIHQFDAAVRKAVAAFQPGVPGR